MNKKFLQLLVFLSITNCFLINAGIGAQFDIDQYAKQIQEKPILITPPSSPRGILRKNSKYQVEESKEQGGWTVFVIDLLKCLER